MTYSTTLTIPDMTYEQALDVLHEAVAFGIEPTLESVREMLNALGSPDASYRIIQIAGTNGKTSTSRFTAGILQGEGYRTALYTSPELIEYPERIEIDCEVISKELFAHGISAAVAAGKAINKAHREALEPERVLTEFELLTVAALYLYAEADIDVAVLEVGMGGRWDATSATNPDIVAITGIGLDHTHILGNTLSEVAAEKAAIIKPGRAVILGEGVHYPEVQAVIDHRLHNCHVDARNTTHEIVHTPSYLGDNVEFVVPAEFASYKIAFTKPAYQPQNAACAINICEEYIGHELNSSQLTSSLSVTPTPGRFDCLQKDPLVLIDACHNPQSVENFLASVDLVEPDHSKRPMLLMAVLADKDVEGICKLLVNAFPSISVTSTSSTRALSAQKLASLLRSLGCEPAAVYENVDEAVCMLNKLKVPYVACGSITLAGEIARLYR